MGWLLKTRQALSQKKKKVGTFCFVLVISNTAQIGKIRKERSDLVSEIFRKLLLDHLQRKSKSEPKALRPEHQTGEIIEQLDRTSMLLDTDFVVAKGNQNSSRSSEPPPLAWSG